MIYIASKTRHAEKWKVLRAHGVPFNSTWIDEAGPGESASMSDLWSRCISEASRAEVLIAYKEPDDVLKGALVEIGAALSSGRFVLLVGFDADNFSFKHHPFAKCCKDVQEALTVALRELKGTQHESLAAFLRSS